MRKLDWIPLYIDRLLSSPAWNDMKDYQRGWYIQLLLRCTRSERLGHLKVDGTLWKIAGAHSRAMWDNHKAAVMACFKIRDEDGTQWLYNDRLLVVMEEQSKKLRRRAEDSHLSISPSDLAEFSLKQEEELCPVKSKRFTKPTLDEVKAYVHQRGDLISADGFVDFYESVGWKRGKTPMIDWRATVRTWEQRIEGNNGQNGSSGRNHQAKAPRKTVQHERWEQNLAAVRTVFPDLNLGANPDHDGAGQETRLSARDSRLLEGEVKPIR